MLFPKISNTEFEQTFFDIIVEKATKKTKEAKEEIKMQED